MATRKLVVKTSDLRKAIPMRVKLQAALLAAGFSFEEVTTPGAIEFDHTPPLGLRRVVGNDFDPPQHAPQYITPRAKADHRKKTSGAGATCADSDVHKIHKARRLSREHEEFQARILAPDKKRDERPRSKWPKRQIARRRK
ncbi:hypothetical protein [Methylosinus sporium]|uniref:Uncharacterized protein n=1 Tax=Methylosinus sporium TaxID=428 RepID=A0A2U1SSX4_METSR|nr:hypothetical protein [Methylosinus sporium]PWB94705.1 hypothetical protein C5689_06475 [Methylosinus sporium]